MSSFKRSVEKFTQLPSIVFWAFWTAQVERAGLAARDEAEDLIACSSRSTPGPTAPTTSAILWPRPARKLEPGKRRPAGSSSETSSIKANARSLGHCFSEFEAFGPHREIGD